MKSLLIPAFCLALLATGCKDEKKVTPSTPNEAITTVILQAIPQTMGRPNVVTAKWNQKTASDGNPIGEPDTSLAVLTLPANAVFDGRIVLIDSTQTPPSQINAEIEEENIYHLFFYQPTPTSGVVLIPGTPNLAGASPLNLTVDITDRDSSAAARPVGLRTRLTTGAPSTGRLRVVLRHQPGGKDGSYAPGSSDMDVYIRVNIVP